MKTFWMCYVEGGDSPRKEYPSYESACADVERLAKLATNIGRRIYVMEALVVCESVVNMSWCELEDTVDGDIPF